MSNLLMKMAMKAVEPHLNKIPLWLEDMAKQFNMDECYLMIRSKTIEGKKTPMMLVMGSKDNKLSVVKDEQGKDVEYGIENLFGYVGGSKDDEDEE